MDAPVRFAFERARRARLTVGLVRLAAGVADLGLWLAAAALLMVVVLNAINIALRYFFFSPLPWAEEAMMYLMIFGVYAGAIAAAWQQAHIRIDALVNLAPARLQRALAIAGALLLAVILGPVVLASYRVVALLYDFDERSDALQLPMWIPQGIIPAALLMIIVLSLLRALTQEPGGETAGEQRAGDGPVEDRV